MWVCLKTGDADTPIYGNLTIWLGNIYPEKPMGPEDVNGAKDQFITESLYAHLLCLSVAAKSDGFHGQVSTP